jgi:hypothetical protein
MKFLYLDAQMLDDNIANTILFKNEIFAYHTWYARSYNVNEKHTNRINKILESVDLEFSNLKDNSDLIIFKDELFLLRKKYKKFLTRLSNRIKIIFKK